MCKQNHNFVAETISRMDLREKKEIRHPDMTTPERYLRRGNAAMRIVEPRCVDIFVIAKEIYECDSPKIRHGCVVLY